MQAGGDGDERCRIAGERAVDADVKQRVAGGDAAADLDDGSGGSAERGSGQNEREGTPDAVSAAGEVMAEFMGEENGQQGEGEGKPQAEAAEQCVGVRLLLQEPRPGPEIVVAADGGTAIEEVLHVAGADGGGGDEADGEQKDGQDIFPEDGVGRARLAGGLRGEGVVSHQG